MSNGGYIHETESRCRVEREQENVGVLPRSFGGFG